MIMRKFVEKLANSTCDKKIGNHRTLHRVFANKGDVLTVQSFIYYDTTICKCCDALKVFAIDASYSTRSTTDACNSYRQYFKSKDYEELYNMDLFIEYIQKQLKEAKN